MKKREKEPYTFVSKEDLKDSVAAHQAECSCHPIGVGGIGQIVCCEDRGIPEPDACDSSGQPWHLDPLCKVRPEAKA